MRCPAKESKNGYDERIERRGEKRKGKGKVQRAVSRGEGYLLIKGREWGSAAGWGRIR